jgi:hypothetical protein
VTEDNLIASLQKPVLILLGEADNDPHDKCLRKAAIVLLVAKNEDANLLIMK